MDVHPLHPKYGTIGFDLPSGYVKIAIENGPVEIVDLPIYPIKMVIFQFANCESLPARVFPYILSERLSGENTDRNPLGTYCVG